MNRFSLCCFCKSQPSLSRVSALWTVVSSAFLPRKILMHWKSAMQVFPNSTFKEIRSRPKPSFQ